MFVGEDRHAAVQGLIEAFDRVASAEGPEMVCLVAPIGWGKTRIVQEFYGRLASDRQDDPRYWPVSIVAATDVMDPVKLRKRVYPARFAIPGKSVPPWMWWALSCQAKADGSPTQAILEAKHQLFTHAEALERRLTSLQRLAGNTTAADIRDKALALAGLLGVFVPPVGWAAAVHDTVAELYSTGRDLVDSRRRNRHFATERAVDAESADWTAMVEELADSLTCSGSGPASLPIVVVVDDAHDAGDDVVGLLHRLLVDRSTRVLIIATAHPDRVALQAASSTGFGHWLTSPPGRVGRIDLERLKAEDLADLVREVAPRTDMVTIGGLIDRAGGNPFHLGLILSLRVVLRSIRHEAITLPPEEIADIPSELRRLYLEKWNELPGPVREALAVASVQGSEFVDECARAAALAVGLEEAAEALPQAGDPYAWVRDVDETLREFLEPAQFGATTEARSEVLSSTELVTLRASIIDWVARSHDNDEWNRLSHAAQECLLKNLYTFALDGLTDDLGAAGTNAVELAHLQADDHRYVEAISTAKSAIDWLQASTPDDEAVLSARSYLAHWSGEIGQLDEAIRYSTALLADRSRVLDRTTLTPS